MQGNSATTSADMPPPPPPTSPPASPSAHHHTSQRPSTAPRAMHRAKGSNTSRFDGLTSRSSDEDSKTAVKVAVRVRPPLKASDPGFDLIPQRFRESTCEAPTPTSLNVQSPQGKKLFVFDRVFDEETTQNGIWDYLSDSVTSFVKGYNVSILAYGQSGSGKSYTMGTSGPEDQGDPRIMGVVPRAATALFEKLTGTTHRQSGLQTPKRYSTQNMTTMGSLAKAINANAEKNWTLKASYVEIYQEQLRDLLIPEHVPQQDRQQVQIREDTKGRILITGLTQLTINSVDDLLNALNFGSSIRQTDSTNINARSSRSHAVFSLNLIQKKADRPPTARQEKRMSTPVESVSGAENVVTLDSKLHFVDLAGSERLKNTGATGDRAKEGISINAGLASLGKVIAQLSSKHSHAHISYRDSKLTRLLQDSLGGNAITFMVACVTPAVFHLSETLNTVHYAQRARAIQSKPEIQQTREEGDKQAAIDRLRAEVSFLRDQIRHSEHADNFDSRGRSDKMRGREAELESQLMDMQENYNALSVRHAKLISELSKGREGEEGDSQYLSEAVGANASERIKRSNSFAEAVESIILEYEKTIQTLESSLSKTRSTLSNSESTLLEKETRIAYMETIQAQLQARVQKAADREQNNESYLQDLEQRMEGNVSGEEKNAALISELRKELARMREGENSAEDYISTLEERLAEAEQDAEIMQREIDRLEHVVERQRSIGRLDNLLGELDGIRRADGQDEAPGSRDVNGDEPKINGYHKSDDPFRAQSRSDSSRAATRADDFEDAQTEPTQSEYTEEANGESATQDAIKSSDAVAKGHRATQSDFMADKVENLTQELFDLQSEHENVLTDYDKLQQKYQTALETLARLEYDKEDAKRRKSTSGPSASFLEEAKAAMAGPSSSLLSSSALHSQQRSNSSLEDLMDKTEHLPTGTEEREIEDSSSTEGADAAQTPLPDDIDDDELSEVEMLRRLHAQREVGIAELTKKHEELQAEHEATLVHVEELKQEVSRARDFRPSSPSYAKPYFSRRKSENLMGSNSDQATKSITSLKTIADDNIEDSSDARQSFQLHLNTVMNELNARSDRVQSMEAELATAKKEMEQKQTIIAGLNRERGSLKASLGVDFSVVQQMREQLLESENQIRLLHEQHAEREKELQGQVDTLRSTLAAHITQLPTPAEDKSSSMPGGFAQTPPREINDSEAMAGASLKAEQQAQDITRLQNELNAWETRHQHAMESMKGSESKLLQMIADLEASLRQKEVDQSARSLDAEPSGAAAAAAASLEQERAKHQQIVSAMQREIDDYKSAANSHVTKLQELEVAYASISQQVEEDSKTRNLSSRELETHKGLVANLQNQLEVHKSAVTIHQESLESLQASHSKEVNELKASIANAERVSNERYSALEQQHKNITESLRKELSTAQSEKTGLLRSASSALGYETDASKLHSQIKGLVEEGKEIHSRHLKKTNELKAVQEELQNALNNTVDLENKISELKTINEETISGLEKMTEKEKKSSRLVEELTEKEKKSSRLAKELTEKDKKSSRLIDELEEQLNNNFDSHQATTNRLSTMQGEVAQQRINLERELENQKMKNLMLEQQVEAFKRQSVASEAVGNLNRESLSPEAAAIALARSGSSSSQGARKGPPTALPTPPPSIPLPPLPGSPTAISPIPSGLDSRATSPPLQRATSPPNNNSPPESRHASHEPSPAMSQQIEEQEARIRTIEKHLFAEKQLTSTLEEALVDLETSANRTKSEMEGWRKKCSSLEDELASLQKERSSSRASLQAVEEEREMRVRAERARQALEQRMAELHSNKKKKKSSLNCF